MLKCPVCEKKLMKREQVYVCENRHSFDIAKQGYTNLYRKSSKQSGDNKEMVKARTAFFAMGFYQPLAMKLLSILKNIKPKCIVDAGCGEGYYTNFLQGQLNTTIYAFDLSKEALKYASSHNQKVHYFLSSVFALPIVDESCDVLLNIFAPFTNDEYLRLIKKGGYLIKVDPNHHHLKQMKQFLYDSVYENDTFALDVEGFTLATYEEVNIEMNLYNEAIKALFKMTPYYYKTEKEKALQLMSLAHMKCDASFLIYLYKKN